MKGLIRLTIETSQVPWSPTAGVGSTISSVGEAEEHGHISRCVTASARLTGERPRGWYTGRPSPNTNRP